MLKDYIFFLLATIFFIAGGILMDYEAYLEKTYQVDQVLFPEFLPIGLIIIGWAFLLLAIIDCVGHLLRERR